MGESSGTLEARRQRALADYRVLDSARESGFDDLVSLAAQVCQVPMAIISLVDADRQWFKASVGMDVAETPRRLAFCDRVVSSGQGVAVHDLRDDEQFGDNPMVTGPPGLRFYAGLPLLTPDGLCIGTLAVLDTKPRTLNSQQQKAQETLTRMAMHTLELRRTRLALEDSLTEQKHLLDEIRTRDREIDMAHQRLNFHLENLPVAVVELDHKLRVSRWSPQARKMFGWQQEEVLGQELQGIEMVHPEDRTRVSAEIEAMLAPRKDSQLTLINRNLTRDGDLRICEWHNSARFDADGELVSILSFAIDITARQQTEKALRRSEERFRHAAEASQAALWDFDMLTGKIRFSSTFRDMLGYQRIEDMPDTMDAYSQLIHPEDRERISREVERLLAGATGDRASAEFRLLTRSGQYRWVQSNSKLIRDEGGQAVRRLGSTIDIHERRQAEQQLREQAERMRGVLEAASDAIITIDESGVVESINPATERMLGYSSDELLGNNIRKVMTESDRKRHAHHLRRYLETGEARIMGSPQRLQARRKDGSSFPIELTVSEVCLSRRRIFTGFIRDVTFEEQARTALEASEQRFRAVARATTDVIWDLELETGELWWSDGLEKAFGYSLSDAGNKVGWWTERVHPDDRDRVVATLETAFRQQTEWGERYRFLHKDGHYSDVLDCGFLVPGQDGQPDRMVGGMKDITEERRSQLKLAEQARLLNEAHDAILVADLDGVVTFWNRGAERVYGWKAEEMTGTSLVGRIVPDDQAWERAVRELLDTEVWDGPVRHQRRDGKERQMQSHLTLVRDANDNPKSILAINADVTERLALEEQLRHSQKLESIGQLTGGVAHDFNNLLTVILGNAELLSDGLDSDPPLKAMAEMTHAAARRGADLIRQLLAFARRQTLEPQTVDVAGLVHDLGPLLKRSLPAHIDISFNDQPDLWCARIDPTQLESAILNLALNARDAMPNGGRLSISINNREIDDDYAALQLEVQPGDYLELSVTDTGHGIHPKDMEHLFEPFFTTKEKGKGTGLGLAMVYGFIKQSGGHINVYSEVDVGTTIRMYLPRADGRGERPARTARNESKLLGTERILLVEDDPMVLEHVCRLVEQLGYQVSTARDGDEALELARSQPAFDLLFTDVIMPGKLRGPDLAREMRRIHSDIRVLFTSGYPEDAIVTRSEDGERINLLQKPYRKADLARRLREALDG